MQALERHQGQGSWLIQTASTSPEQLLSLIYFLDTPEDTMSYLQQIWEWKCAGKICQVAIGETCSPPFITLSAADGVYILF